MIALTTIAAPKIEKDEIDNFTGDRRIYTSWVRYGTALGGVKMEI